MQPNGKWHIHDDDRPRPVVVTPGPFAGLPAPADAIVLLGSGTDLSKWQMQDGGGPVTWPIDDGVLSSGKGFIQTKQNDFTDYQLHVEFATPSDRQGRQPGPRQQRRLPERRVRDPGARQLQQQDLCRRPGVGDVRPDSADGERVAARRASGRPTTSSSAARASTATTLEKPAVVTVLHNGVLVHNADAVLGADGPQAESAATPRRTRRARSVCRTTAIRSASATSGSGR